MTANNVDNKLGLKKRNQLRFALWALGKTDREIAKATDGSANTVIQWRKSRGLMANPETSKAARQIATWAKRRAARAKLEGVA